MNTHKKCLIIKCIMIFMIITGLMICDVSCSKKVRKSRRHHKLDATSSELKLKDELIHKARKNYDATPISSVKLSDIAHAHKQMDKQDRQDYYIKILGKKVQWSGNVERMYVPENKKGIMHIIIDPPVEEIDMVYLEVSENLNKITDLKGENVVFTGIIYKIGPGGVSFLTNVNIKNRRKN